MMIKSEGDCETFEVMLSGYHDGALSLEDTQRVEEHLQTCPHCPLKLEEMQKIGNLIRENYKREIASQDFKGFSKAIQGRLPSEPGFPRPSVWLQWRPFLIPSSAAAVALALVLGVFFLLQTGEQGVDLPSPVTQELKIAMMEKGKFQREMGLGIRNYGLLQHILLEREALFHKNMAALEENSFLYSTPGALQEDMGRTIRDYAFIRYLVKQMGGVQQAKIGKGIQSMAQLKLSADPRLYNG